MNRISNKYKNLPVQVKASLWFLMCSFLQRGISVITTPIFTRLLSTTEYGKYNVFNSWFSITNVFVSLGLTSVYTQGLIKYDNNRNVFSSAIQGLNLTLVIGWTVIYLAFHNQINSAFTLTTEQMLLMLTMIWTESTFSLWSAEQRVYYKYKALVIITILVSLAKPLLGIILVQNSYNKVTARILGLVLVELIGYSWCYIVQMHQGKKYFSKKIWAYALAYCIPLVPHYLSQVVLNNSDRIMIEKMAGDSAAGMYGLAYSLAMIMTLFNTALLNTLTPWIYQKIKDRDIKSLAPVVYVTFFIVAAVNLLLIMFAPEAVRIFAPESYYEAVYCIPPVAMSVLFIYFYDIFSKFAFFYSKTKLIMTASMIGAVLNLILNYFGIRMFGYVAAAYTTLLCYMLYSLFHYIVMTKICNTYLDGIKPYNAKFIILFSLAFIIFGLLMLLTYAYPMIRYSVIIATFIAVIWKRQTIRTSVQKIIELRKIK